jgi:TonB-dependent starch-binding outer membrane protein SusC
MKYIFTLIKKTRSILPGLMFAISLLIIGISGTYGFNGNMQEKTVYGRVKSFNTGETLVGVTVQETGTNRGTFTDDRGEFSLVVSGPEARLQFSYVGFLTEVIDVGEQTIIEMVMVEDIMSIDEVVVIGYGVQRKSDLTGSVESVRTTEMQKLAVPSVAEALQGRASGVFVTRGSGQPGTDATIYIRGPGSVNNTAPLWIIDGLPSNAGNHLELSDIESIEILKDASAAAIYGAKAANGVILVTTKRGSRGKPKINFNSTYGIAQPLNLPDLVDSRSFATLRHESYRNGNFAAGLNQVYTSIVNNPDSVLPVSTDWMDVLYKNGATQNYTLDFSGGTEQSNFYASLGYFTEDGTYINTSFERFTGTINSDHNISKWFKVGQSLTLSQTKRENKHLNQFAALRVNPFMEVLMDSADHPYTPYGVLGTEYGFVGPNPYGVEMIQDQMEVWYRTRGNIYVNIQPVKGLNWRTTFGGAVEMLENEHYTERYDLGHTLSRDVDRLTINQTNIFSYTANSVLNYQFSVQKHDFEAMAGAEIQSVWGDNYNLAAEDFRDGLIIFNQSDPLLRTLEGNKVNPTRWSSQFGRINYGYDSRYLFTFNIRRDGSSLFPPGNRFGYFPSFSAGWRVTNEPFMANLASMMDLKIRMGYGAVGNASVAPFAYYSQYSGERIYYVLGGNLQTGILPSVFGVGNIQWESINTTNFGIDLYLLNYRLSITNDFYIKDTRDMLIYVDLPPNAGMGLGGNTLINAGNIRNIGNDLSLQYRDEIGSFKYNLGGNFSFNRHTVKDLVDQEINKGELAQFKTMAGQPMSFYEGFIVDGIWQESEMDDLIEFLIRNNQLSEPSAYTTYNYTAPGDFKYKDINGDGLIDDRDRVEIGNPWPKFVYGFNMGMDYKGFDFYAFFQGVYGNDIYHLNKRVTDNLTGDYSFTYNAFNRWTPENPTNQPRIVYADPNANLSRSSSYFVEKGSYLRLKNLQLGYTLPTRILPRLDIEKLRIYVSGQNLITVTNYTGMDPEISTGSNTDKNLDQGMYPQSRTFLLGLQLSF